MFLTGVAPEPHAAWWAWLRICFVVSSVIVWFQQHKKLKDLERRLSPRIVIRNLSPRVWPSDLIPFTGKEYYFDIFNASETESLENVRVEANSLPDAIGYPNVPWHVRNDGYETREFSINPASIRQIDLITGPVNKPDSQKLMIVAHTVNTERRPIPYGRYQITVKASAKNTPPATAVFQAWIEAGELKCVAL